MLTRTYYPRTYRSAARPWTPFSQLQSVQEELNRLLSTGLGRSGEYPPINVWSNEDETIVQAELPGYDADKIDISVVPNTLTLRGERSPEEAGEGATLHRRERTTGRFVRTVELPFEVDNGKVDAAYRNGILSVRLPRAEEHKPRRITVNAS